MQYKNKRFGARIHEAVLTLDPFVSTSKKWQRTYVIVAKTGVQDETFLTNETFCNSVHGVCKLFSCAVHNFDHAKTNVVALSTDNDYGSSRITRLVLQGARRIARTTCGTCAVHSYGADLEKIFATEFGNVEPNSKSSSPSRDRRSAE